MTADELIALANKRILRAVQTLLICSVAAILVPWYEFFLFGAGYKPAPIDLFVPVFFSPLWLPALVAAWRLRENCDIQRIASGLSLSCGWSQFAAILSFAILLATTRGDINYGAAVYTLIVLSLQFASFPLALWGYRKLLLACNEKAWPWTGLGIGVFAAIPFFLIIPQLFHGESSPYEPAAVGSLRSIVVAQNDYANLHPETGFATTLQELGDPKLDLIDQTLARGKKAKYTFVLKPGPRDLEGRIDLYTVIAIPVNFSGDMSRSFFVDESGVIRYTTARRPATAQDPALQ